MKSTCQGLALRLPSASAIGRLRVTRHAHRLAACGALAFAAPLTFAQSPGDAWRDDDGAWDASTYLSAVESRVGCVSGALNVQTCGPGSIRQAELAIETLWRRVRGVAGRAPGARDGARPAPEEMSRWRLSLTRSRLMVRFEQRF